MERERQSGGGQYVCSFPPVIGERPRVLVLGSMPGPVSLRKGEYYGHPRNHFWQIIYGIFGLEPHPEYSQRLQFLRGRGIALWDSLAACRRRGSSDQEIREEEYHDVIALVQRYPSITLIACNGSKAERSFLRGVKAFRREEALERSGTEHRRLPSTSPIPTKSHKNWRDKLTAWSIVADHCE